MMGIMLAVIMLFGARFEPWIVAAAAMSGVAVGIIHRVATPKKR